MKRTQSTQVSPGAAVLWASAFVIAAMAILQAGRLQPNPAHAHMALEKGDYTLITTASGRGENTLLYVIDSRNQVLMVYEVDDARRGHFFLRDGGSLDSLFQAARR